MAIYILEIPEGRVRCWTRPTEAEVLAHVAERYEGNDVRSLDDALALLRTDNVAVAVFRNDDEAIHALQTGEGLPGPQHRHALEALLDTFAGETSSPSTPTAIPFRMRNAAKDAAR